MSTNPSPSVPVAAFAVMAIGATGLTLGDMFFKLASNQGVSLPALITFAWPLGAALLAFLAHFSGGIAHHLAPRHPGKLAIRALLLLIVSTCNVSSIMLNTYGQHAILFQLSPVFGLALGVALTRIKLTLPIIAIFAAASAGTFLVFDPFSGVLALTLLFTVGAAFFNAGSNAYQASQSNETTAIGFAFYAINGVGLFYAIIWLAFERQVPSLGSQLWIQLSAVCSVVGIGLAGQAMRMAGPGAARISAMLLIQVPVALILGWLVFGEVQPIPVLLGGAILAGAGIAISFSTRKA